MSYIVPNNYADAYARDIALVLDNDEALAARVYEDIMVTIRDCLGYGHATTVDEYRETLAHDGEWTVAASLTSVFYDVLGDIILECTPSIAADLLRQLVVDDPIMRKLAIDAVPTVESYAEWLDEQD